MALLACFGGLILLVLVLQDAFEVMLLPRRVARRWRIMRGFFRVSWSLWRAMARTFLSGVRRERFLGIFGPLSMAMLFSLWAAGLIVAFGLLQWGLQTAEGYKVAFGQQAYLSGVTFFTLGYGDVLPRGAWAKLIAVGEAGAGFGLIAVVIGYLPVLYQLFARREAHVIQLDARAGSPPSAVGMLRRHAESDGLDRIDELLRAWEIWAAELLESHLSYPMLAYYRSQHHDQSWLGALAAIMDACALILVGVEDIKPLQARMTFGMARQVVVEIARSMDLRGKRNDAPERLDSESFSKIVKCLEEVDVRWSAGPQGEEVLAGLRATYEPSVRALADYLLVDIPNWLPPTETSDHWERGPRGIIASRIIQGLASGALEPNSLASQRRSLLRRRPGDHVK